MAKQTDGIDTMRKRYQMASDHVKAAYDMSRDDVRFVAVPGNQWDQKLRARRGDRPTYEFPKLNSSVRQVINEMRQNRPAGKVRGAEEGDRALAELMQGLCRNIESVSNADQAYDIAYEFAVQGGFGVWRICTDYAKPDDFDLDIFIKPVRNPFGVKFDSASVEIDRRDANWAFVEELIPESEFKARYPKANISDFEDDASCVDWREAGQVRIAEYWEKVPRKRRLLALSDNRVVYLDELAKQAGIEEAEVLQVLEANGIRIIKEREVDDHKVIMRLTNGHEWLGEPYEFPSKFIPLVPCWGNIQNVDGKDVFYGLVRPNKDQQRLHNVHRTAAIEAVAKAPKAPFIVKMKWIQPFKALWDQANADDRAYLPVSDDAPDQMDQIARTRQAEIPSALIQLASIDNEDIKAGTGIYDASLGARSNETSGKAINARAMQGATATFNYVDNLAYAIRYTYEILVDMVPKVYDTQRVVRTLGEDGGEKWKTLYQEVPVTDAMGNPVLDMYGQPRTMVVNDLSKGKYDVVVTIGPSFATQRMEAVDAFTSMLGQMGPGLPPQIAALMAFTVFQNMDLPGADTVESAFKKLLVSQGVLDPEDGEQPPQQGQPNPADIAKAEKDSAQAKNYSAQADKNAAEAMQINMQNAAQMTALQMSAQPMFDPGQLPQGGPFQGPYQGGVQ